MFSVLLQSLLLASGGIVSAGSITLVILLLISDRGWRNGLGYMLGYTGAYTLIGLMIVLAGYNTGNNGSNEGGLFAPITFIVLGTLLLTITVRNWRKPPTAPEDKTSPRLFTIVDKATPLKTFWFGIFVSVANFKNLAIFLSAISVVHLSDLALTEKIISALLVTFVFCLSVIVPVLIYVLFPHRARETLSWIKQTTQTHSHAISIWLPLIFGLFFLYKGIANLL
ncbi:MAG: hypothetical protein Kow002_09670 [Anaerolineales bacterium]